MNDIYPVYTPRELDEFGKYVDSFKTKKKDKYGEYESYNVKEILKAQGIFSKHGALFMGKFNVYEVFMDKLEQLNHRRGRIQFAKRAEAAQLDELAAKMKI